MLHPRASLLHVGCGGDALPDWLEGYAEVRLDIDETCEPDIVANMTDMGDIGSYDMVLCQHALEHLPPHEVPVALAEFHRVLKQNGSVLLFVPDMQGVEPTEEVLFQAPVGPITGLDLMYGYRPMLKEKPYMAHRMGFVADTLKAHLTAAGFSAVEVRRFENHALLGAARK